jgi:hypothetical protein
MHLSTSFAVLATAFTTLTSASSTLQKRCTPYFDRDLPGGYLPPAPCWQGFDTACRPHLLPNTEMTLDARHRLAVVYNISSYCASTIAEEISRTAQGLKNFGWIQNHGWMTVIEPQTEGSQRILVLSDMPQATVERYANLTYPK